MAMALLPYLVAKGYEVKVISDESSVIWMAQILGLNYEICQSNGRMTINENCDLFLCCHGNRVIEKESLMGRLCVNIHPCLEKYKGKDPISKYITSGDTQATIDSHYMTEVVDGGKVIVSVPFVTGEVKTHAEFYNQALGMYYLLLDKTLTKLFP